MIITRSNFDTAVTWLEATTRLSLDTETTGLRPYQGDRLFSLIIGVSFTEAFYFNFQAYPGIDADLILTSEHLRILNDLVFSDPNKIWYMHNAKYDLAILANEHCEIKGPTFCCKALGRVEYNAHLNYDLDSSLKRIGISKSFDLKEYCVEKGLWEWEQIPGKKKREKRIFANKVDYNVITEYGVKDGTGTLALGCHLEVSILKQAEQAEKEGLPTLLNVRRSEVRLTDTVFRLEKVGVKIDRGYCVRAAQYEADRAEKACQRFKTETGREYKASPKLFAEIFSDERDHWEYTEEGNPSFDADSLRRLKNPVAKVVLELRDAKSKSDFYNGFLFYADSDDRVHPTFNPDGALHGRFSSSNPNFQNLTAEEDAELEEEFVVRRAIIPAPGFFFIMPDYDQMEYRLMLELACRLVGHETRLVELVKTGLDVHEATARIASETGVKITRTEAKHSNFLTLYGGGDQKLVDTINKLSQGKTQCTLDQARAIRTAIFKGAPEISALVHAATKTAETRGFVRNWWGRRNYFPNTRFAYRAINYLVSGGCADVVKIAMNRVDDLLLLHKSRMVLTIHDELPCEIHESEAFLVPKIKEIMESVFESKYLALTTGMEWSRKSLGDKTKGMP